MKPMFVGMAYDDYTPAMQAQAFSDLLAYIEAARKRNRKLVLVTRDNKLDGLANQLGVTCSRQLALAKTWRAYRVKVDPELPDHAERVTVVNLRNKKAKPTINKDSFFYGAPLKEQGRMAPPSRMRNRPSPMSQVSLTPSLAIWFGAY